MPWARRDYRRKKKKKKVSLNLGLANGEKEVTRNSPIFDIRAEIRL